MSSTIYLRKIKDLENTLSKEYICSEVLKSQKQIEQLKKENLRNPLIKLNQIFGKRKILFR